MDGNKTISSQSIEELINSSKQFQSKMQQEIEASTMLTKRYTTEKPSIFENKINNSYLKNVIGDYFQENNRCEKDMRIITEIKSTSRSPTSKQSSDKKTENFKPVSVVGNTVETKKLSEIIKCSKPKKNADIKVYRSLDTKNSPKKNVSSRNSLVKTNDVNSKSNLISSSLRLPLQRFVETPKEKLSFAQEHPNIELDMSNRQTLFPRRLPKQTKTLSPHVSSCEEHNSINLAEAYTFKVNNNGTKEQETWKEVLLKNQPQKPTKIVKLKKSISNEKLKKETKKHEPMIANEIDIISTQSKSLYLLKKWPSNQSNLNFQHFPVMSIPPECQVQQVTNISIRGDSETNRYPLPADNVKYVECSHVQENVEVSSISPPNLEENIAGISINPKCTNSHRESHLEVERIIESENNHNKFFKALDFSYQSKSSSESMQSSMSSTPSRTTPQSFSPIHSLDHLKSLSSLKLDDSTQGSIKEMHDNSHDFQKNVPKRTEAYVQTDSKTTKATSTSPLPSSSPPELIPQFINRTFSKPTSPNITPPQHTTNQKENNIDEEDLITKIFERIRNDIPNALKAYRNRTSSTQTEYPNEEQNQQPIQSHQHPMTAISATSNIEMPLNEDEQRFARIQANGHKSSDTILPKPQVNSSPITYVPTSTKRNTSDRFLMLQQNPLFVQTRNKIKSTTVNDAMTGDEEIRGDIDKHPTDMEIKRAVKIFIDSLTPDNSSCGGERKSIGNRGKNGSRLPSLALLNRVRLMNPASSDSLESLSILDLTSKSCSSTRSSKHKYSKTKNNMFLLSESEYSRSTSISSSDAEPESEPSQNHLSDAKSLSEGEVLSMGEV